MSEHRRPSPAQQRYSHAYRECQAATAHLASQHVRRELVADVNRPVLDPEYEAALDRLNAAEIELRRAYELWFSGGRQLQHAD